MTFLSKKLSAAALLLVSALGLSACGSGASMQAPSLTQRDVVPTGTIREQSGNEGMFANAALATCGQFAANPQLIDAQTGLHGYHVPDGRFPFVGPSTPGFRKFVDPTKLGGLVPIACPAPNGQVALPIIGGRLSCGAFANPEPDGSHQTHCDHRELTQVGNAALYGGGALAGGAGGAAIGYKLGGKEGAIIGAIAGGIAGLGGAKAVDECGIQIDCTHLTGPFSFGN